MQIQLNGETKEIPENSTVSTLVKELGLGRFAFAVERNGEVVPRGDQADTPLRDGDLIEVVTFVGGG